MIGEKEARDGDERMTLKLFVLCTFIKCYVKSMSELAIKYLSKSRINKRLLIQPYSNKMHNRVPQTEN